MKSCDLAMTITALACCIAENRTTDEIDLLAVIFTQLGDSLATISFQEALCAEKSE